MNTKSASVLSKVILSDRKINIKLLGDSITHGVGGTGFVQNGEPIVAGFRRNPDGYCWAKQFKEHMEKQYDCTVTNNACTGTTIEFIIKHFDTLVSPEDDIVICTIGTNNRHQYVTAEPQHNRREHMEEFYGNIEVLYKKFRAADKDVIFVANIPASSENEKDGADYRRLFHMNDVRDIYFKASVECGFPFISLYDKFLDYCEREKITVDSLLIDGLHPNDKGYDVMFTLIMKELGVYMK
ncbi:MAG: SGNH/GDSL hydrolase family protein [Ruminococcaceae bacterium]|nr:SGNH/GDSL hydrolase family protein [Oscillospiraceae bacterium]